MFFKNQYQEIKEIGEKIFKNPELGYKEFKTKESVIELLPE